jgi:hypothetical protein
MAAMTVKRTEEQRQALAGTPGRPLRVADDAGAVEYVLLRADLYDRLQAALADGADVEGMYPLLADVAPEAWQNASTYGDRP